MQKKIFQIHAERQRSGQSVRTLCQKYKISENSYYYWRKKISQLSDDISTDPLNQRNASSDFISVSVGTNQESVVEDTFQIIYPNHVRIEFKGSVSTDRIRDLITIYQADVYSE